MKNLRTFKSENGDIVELNKGFSRTIKEDAYFIIANGIEVKQYPLDYKNLAEDKYKSIIKDFK